MGSGWGRDLGPTAFIIDPYQNDYLVTGMYCAVYRPLEFKSKYPGYYFNKVVSHGGSSRKMYFLHLKYFLTLVF